MAAVSAGSKLSVLEDQRDDRAGEGHQPKRRRDVEHQHQTESVRQRRLHARVIRLVCEPRHRRRHRRRDRDAEQSDREIHQTKRVVEPGDGARALIGGQHRVDEDVDLCRRKADGPRKHEHQNASQAWIMRVERRTVAIAFAREGRPLDQQLSKTADERPNGDDHDRVARRSAGRQGRAPAHTRWCRR